MSAYMVHATYRNDLPPVVVEADDYHEAAYKAAFRRFVGGYGGRCNVDRFLDTYSVHEREDGKSAAVWLRLYSPKKGYLEFTYEVEDCPAST